MAAHLISTFFLLMFLSRNQRMKQMNETIIKETKTSIGRILFSLQNGARYCFLPSLLKPIELHYTWMSNLFAKKAIADGKYYYSECKSKNRYKTSAYKRTTRKRWIVKRPLR